MRQLDQVKRPVQAKKKPAEIARRGPLVCLLIPRKEAVPYVGTWSRDQLSVFWATAGRAASD